MAEQNASATDWIAVFGGALAALMATLDISITNSALPQIQGSIGATGTEGTWISTAYLMSEIVMIPLAAWLTRVFGLRTFLLSNTLLFTVFSGLCALSSTLPQMIVGRIGQGFAGGALIPTAQTIIRTRLPRHQFPIGMTMFGLIGLVGPLLGPVVGGWLASNISWSWCFTVNLPIGIALMLLLYLGLPKSTPNWHEFSSGDWLGIAGLAVGLSSLTAVLEDGQRENWFDSPMIVWLTVAAVLGTAALIGGQFVASRPVVRLKLLTNTNFASVIYIVFVFSVSFYCITFILPQFLSGIAGYDAQQSGAIMLVSALPALVMLPILPQMLGRLDTRMMLIAGLVCFAISCLLDIGLTAESSGRDFFASQLLRGFGQMIALMPLNQAAMTAVSLEETAEAAGLYNMVRNLGGSVGLALLGVFIDRRNAFHDAFIRESITANSNIGQEHIAASAAGFIAQHGDAALANQQALAQLASTIQQQATVMTYSEAFYVLTIVMILCIPLAIFLGKSAQPAVLAEH